MLKGMFKNTDDYIVVCLMSGKTEIFNCGFNFALRWLHRVLRFSWGSYSLYRRGWQTVWCLPVNERTQQVSSSDVFVGPRFHFIKDMGLEMLWGFRLGLGTRLIQTWHSQTTAFFMMKLIDKSFHFSQY